MSELDNYFQYDPTLMDFVTTNYGDVKYLIDYMNATGIDEYTTGITEDIHIPVLDEPVTQEYEKQDTTYIPTTKLNYKRIDMTMFDTVLQNYGDITKIMEHINDTDTKDYQLYREQIDYKQDNINNNLTGYLGREKKGIATDGDIMTIIPSGTTIDNKGDYSQDYSNDFKLI